MSWEYDWDISTKVYEQTDMKVPEVPILSKMISCEVHLGVLPRENKGKVKPTGSDWGNGNEKGGEIRWNLNIALWNSFLRALIYDAR